MPRWLILKLHFLLFSGFYVVLKAKGDYVGCYEYSDGVKLKKTELHNNDGHSCKRFCFPDRYAGTELNLCYCGNDLIGYKVIDSNCFWRCPNRNTDWLYCGGPYRLSMYENTGPPPMTITMATTTPMFNSTIGTTAMSTSKSTNNTGDHLPQHTVWTISVCVFVFAINASILFGFIYRCLRARKSSGTSIEHLENELSEVHCIVNETMDLTSSRGDADETYDKVILPT